MSTHFFYSKTIKLPNFGKYNEERINQKCELVVDLKRPPFIFNLTEVAFFLYNLIFLSVLQHDKHIFERPLNKVTMSYSES